MMQTAAFDRPEIIPPTRQPAAFATGLTRSSVPEAVFARIEDLFVDWAASAFAGRPSRAVKAIDRFAMAMGPQDGPSEVLISGRHTMPYFAAMMNATASHVAEQDDVHNGSVFHPAKAISLICFGGPHDETGAKQLVNTLWHVGKTNRMGFLL